MTWKVVHWVCMKTPAKELTFFIGFLFYAFAAISLASGNWIPHPVAQWAGVLMVIAGAVWIYRYVCQRLQRAE